MEGLSEFQADEWLAMLPALWVQLHTDHPGPNGVLAVAKDARRQPVDFSQPKGGRIQSAEDVSWVNVTGPDTPRYFTAWDNYGKFRFSGACGPESYLSGDKFTIPAGGLVVFLSLAAKG